MNEDWQAMLRSVEKRRDVDARFYKPTCLVAVIDGIADGSLAPGDLDADRVVGRFADYLQAVFPERAALGWRPFWHLSRDGAWIFTHLGRRVGPEDFGRARKPNSRRELMARIDRAAVPDPLREHWRSAAARAELRAAVIAMLRRDDDSCRRVADHLDHDGTVFAAGASREVETTDSPSSSGQRQGLVQSAAVRQAVERHAMGIARDLMEADGWTVEDVSTQRSYDFHCSRDGEVRYVEVKGTGGTGDEIRITAAEVAFANLNPEQMSLIVVSAITCEQVGIDIRASGGRPIVFECWAPEPGDLSPISFFCRLPRAD